MECCLLTFALACCYSRRPSAAVQSGRSRCRRAMLTKEERCLQKMSTVHEGIWEMCKTLRSHASSRVCSLINIESVKLWQLGVSHLIIHKPKCWVLATNNGLLSRTANWVMDSVMFNSGHFSRYSSLVQSRCFINLLVSKEIVFTLPSWVGWAQVLGGFWPSFITTHLCTADRTPSVAYLYAELLLL